MSFSGTVAFERPVVGAQSLQSLAGMMYSGGVTNGRCAHADDGACICYFTLALMRGEHLLAGMMYSPGMSNDRCSHQHDYACAEIFVVVSWGRACSNRGEHHRVSVCHWTCK